MRFDVPTVGPGTVKTMAEAGAAVLAVEAKKTIFIDPEETIRFADDHHIAIVALVEEDVDNPETERFFSLSTLERVGVAAASMARPETN